MPDPHPRNASTDNNPPSEHVTKEGIAKPGRLQRLGVYIIAFPLYALSIAFLLGIVAWGGFNWSMEMTNQERFCISCHAMRDNVYEEYKHTAHYRNPAGVRATCPDCHVPRDWVHKVVRKVRATNELYHWAMGTIDDRDKFLAERGRLSRKVWAFMKQSDSRECRNCHHFESMASDQQSPAAAVRHKRAQENSMTCIDCHIGITHQLSETALDDLHKRFEQDKEVCWNCHIDQPDPEADQGEWDWDTLE